MTEGDREIELKFLCAARDLAAVLAAAPAGDDERRELVSVYFDTPGLDLQKAGASLRVRHSKGVRVQTLKRGEGLSREEYEQPIHSDRPDATLAPLPSLLPKGGAGRLRRAFEVRVVRRQRLVRRGDAEIELALDEGGVRAGRRRRPISEVELELKCGPPAALFGLARELAKAAPLYLCFDSKAARGQALAQGVTSAARRAAGVKLEKDATAADAFQAIARHALAQAAGAAEALRKKPDPEVVHQLRVAVRRLRSALSTFGPMVDDAGLETVKTDLRWLGRALDDARNLDVFVETVIEPARAREAPPPGLDVLARAVSLARRRARARAAEAVSSERFRTLLIDTTAWLETGDWLAAAQTTPVAAQAFAASALDRRRHKLLKRGKGLRHADDAARHQLRIEAKKLRYAAEALASLFPKPAAKRFIARLKDLQEELGALNDIATAEPLLIGLGLKAGAAFAAGELAGLRAAGKPRLIGRAAKAFDRLADVEPFWIT